ncbi:MAG: shikimate kinase [Bacteroidota bacterium]
MRNVKTVVATGGGFAMVDGRMEQMKSVGKVVFLDVPINQLVQRLEKETSKRPLLSGFSGDQLVERIQSLLDARMEIYLQADVVVKGEEDAVEKVLGVLEKTA